MRFISARGRSTVDDPVIVVDVVYAEAQHQHIERIVAPIGSTALEVIAMSSLLRRLPGIDLSKNRIGIYGRLIEPDAVVEDGDRIEIYRPLRADPKTVRRQRAREGRTMGRSR